MPFSTPCIASSIPFSFTFLLRGEKIKLGPVGSQGAVPNHKHHMGKRGVDIPKFIIESDAIIDPLVFAYVLSWWWPNCSVSTRQKRFRRLGVAQLQIPLLKVYLSEG